MDEALKARLIGATVLVALAVLFIPELLSGRKPADLESKQTEGARGTRTFTIELGGPSQGTTVTPPSPAAAAPAVSANASLSTASTPTPTSTTAPTPAPTVAPEPSTQPAAVQAEAKAEAKPEAKPASEPSVAPPKVAEAPTAIPAAKPAATAAKAPASAAPAAGASPAPAIPARGGWAVQVGAFGSTDTANKLVRKLQSAGYKAYVSPVSRGGKALYRVRVGPVAERVAADSMVDGLKAKGLPATVVAND